MYTNNRYPMAGGAPSGPPGMYTSANATNAPSYNAAMNGMSMYSLLQMQASNKAALPRGGSAPQGIVTPPPSPSTAAVNSISTGYTASTPLTQSRGMYIFPPYAVMKTPIAMPSPSSSPPPSQFFAASPPVVAAAASPHQETPKNAAAPVPSAPQNRTDNDKREKRGGRHGNRHRREEKAEKAPNTVTPSTETAAAPGGGESGRHQRRRRRGDGPPADGTDDTRAPSPANQSRPDDVTDAYCSPNLTSLSPPTHSGGAASAPAGSGGESGRRRHRHRHGDRAAQGKAPSQQPQQHSSLRDPHDLNASHHRRHRHHRGQGEDRSRRHRHRRENHKGKAHAPHSHSPAVATPSLVPPPQPSTMGPIIVPIAVPANPADKKVFAIPQPPPVPVPPPQTQSVPLTTAHVNSSKGHHGHRGRYNAHRQRTLSSCSTSSRSSSSSASYSYSDSSHSRNASSSSSSSRGRNRRRSGRGRRGVRRHCSSRSSSTSSSVTRRRAQNTVSGSHNNSGISATPEDAAKASQTKTSKGFFNFFRRNKSSTVSTAASDAVAHDRQSLGTTPLVMPGKSLYSNLTSMPLVPPSKVDGVADKRDGRSRGQSPSRQRHRNHSMEHSSSQRGSPHPSQAPIGTTGDLNSAQNAVTGAAGDNNSGNAGNHSNTAKTFFRSFFHKKKDKSEAAAPVANLSMYSSSNVWVSPNTHTLTMGNSAPNTPIQLSGSNNTSGATPPGSRDGTPSGIGSAATAPPLPPKSGFFSKFMKKKVTKAMAAQQQQQHTEREALKELDSDLEEERRALDASRVLLHKEQRRRRHASDSRNRSRSRSSSASRRGRRDQRGKRSGSRHHSSPPQKPDDRDRHKGRHSPLRRGESRCDHRCSSSSYDSYSRSSVTSDRSETLRHRIGHDKKRRNYNVKDI